MTQSLTLNPSKRKKFSLSTGILISLVSLSTICFTSPLKKKIDDIINYDSNGDPISFSSTSTDEINKLAKAFTTQINHRTPSQ